MYSTKKSRKEISMGASPVLRKKAKASGLRNAAAIGDHMSDINRMTHGSFANFNGPRGLQNRQTLANQPGAHFLQSGDNFNNQPVNSGGSIHENDSYIPLGHQASEDHHSITVKSKIPIPAS